MVIVVSVDLRAKAITIPKQLGNQLTFPERGIVFLNLMD